MGEAHGRGAALCAAALAALLAALAQGAQAPEPAASGRWPVVREEESGRLVVEDRQNRYRLALPGPYWKCSTPEMLAAEARGQGCAGRGRMPPGLLLVVQNKDAPAWVYLQLSPERFLMRTEGELEDYVRASHDRFMQASGVASELLSSSFEKRGPLIVARASVSMSARGRTARYVMVHYFVRPRGEDARYYELVCFAPQEDFERLRGDFEQIIGSFRFTGQAEEQFFVPDAPQEKLPSAPAPGASGGAVPGGRYAGIVVAMVLVLAGYWLLRRRTSRPRV